MIYVLMLCLHIIVTACFLEVYGQGTPVLTIAQSPVTVGDGDQYAELRCQTEKFADRLFVTLTHRIQLRQADLSYRTIATINFRTSGSAVVNDDQLQPRASAVKNDPATATFFAGSLQIRDVICTDAAVYRCQADVIDTTLLHQSTYNSTDVELETIKLPSENPTLSYSPSEINAGDDVQFACNGNVGRPPLQLTIGVSIGSFSLEIVPLTGHVDLSLAVDNCTQNRRVTAGRTFTRDEAKYGVIAQCNVAGNASLVHQRTLDIKYPVGDVEVTIDNSNSQRPEISEGTRITVRCTSQANPIGSHKILFIRDGETAVTEEWSQSILVIGLKKTDAGLYFCEGTNRLSIGNFTDSSQYNITLTVTEPPPTEAPTAAKPDGSTEPPLTEAPTTPIIEPPTEQTKPVHGNTEPESSVNVAAVAAGVIVPIVIVIVVLVAIICVYRRRQDALNDILIQRQASIGNDSIIPDPSSYPVRDVTMSPKENDHYEEIKDIGLVNDDYVIVQNDNPGARHTIRPTTLPDLTSSDPRSNCHDNNALDYEMTTVGTGDSQYVNIDSERKVRVYDRLTSVPVITHSPSPTESPYVNKMVENRGTYENV